MSKLSEPMKAAIRTGRGGAPIIAKLGTIVALVSRGLAVTGRLNTLTAKGREVLAELDAEEAQEKLAKAAVYRVEIETGHKWTTVNGKSWFQDEYRVYRLGGMTPVDTWIATEGEPDYSDSKAQLAAHGWTLHGHTTWDQQVGLYTGRAALNTGFRPQTTDEKRAAAWERVEREQREAPAVEPQPEVVREDVKYRVQISETDGATWRNLVVPAHAKLDSAKRMAAHQGGLFPRNLYRVVEVRETWTVL